MKKSKKIIFVVVAIIAILVSFLGGQAYAKYMSKVTGNGTAEIASWKFKVNENEEKMQEYEINSAKNIIIKKQNQMTDEEIMTHLLKKGYKTSNIRNAIKKIDDDEL